MKEWTVVKLLDDIANKLERLAAAARDGDPKGHELYGVLKEEARRVETAASRLRNGEYP